MDIQKQLRLAVDSGKVALGVNESKKLIANGDARMVFISSDCPDNVKEEIQRNASIAKIPVHVLKQKAVSVGSVCGKPFPISVLTIVDAGNSSILELVK